MYHHIWIGFAGGLVAFAHCLGMCGGFVLHLTNGDNGSRGSGQLLWHTGRISTYAFTGAVAGFAGGFFEQLLPKTHVQNLLSYGAGAMILLMGLILLGVLPVRAGSGADGGIGALLLRHGSKPSPGAALILGIATGFLPCPIVLAFLAYSLQARSVVTGMATMTAMGIGTAAPLLLLGVAGRFIGFRFRRWSALTGGMILIVLGLATVLRGTSAFHHLLGCPPAPMSMEHKRPAAFSPHF